MRHRKANLRIEGAPLVTIPVGLANAQSGAKDPSLSYVFPDGRKGDQVFTHPLTGEVRPQGDMARGVVTGADKDGDVYGIVDGDAWDAIATKAKVDIHGFMDSRELFDRIERIAAVHYVQAQPGFDPESLAIIVRALERTDRVAVARFSVGTKERLGALTVRPDGVPVMLTLVFADHVRVPDDEVMAAVEVEPDESAVRMAEQLIDANPLSGAELDALRDETLAQRQALVEAAARGEALPATKEDTAPSDLTTALEASLKAAGKRPKRARKKVPA